MKIVQERSERVDQIDQIKKSWNKTHEHELGLIYSLGWAKHKRK